MRNQHIKLGSKAKESSHASTSSERNSEKPFTFLGGFLEWFSPEEYRKSATEWFLTFIASDTYASLSQEERSKIAFQYQKMLELFEFLTRKEVA